VFNQTYKDFEIVIIENYVDSSKITPILDLYSKKPQKIQVVTDPTKHLAYLFNISWKSVNTQYIAQLADDVEVSETWLENIVFELSLSRLC
jgi:glycosyltransferase involved in cell wall biosynthesis